MRVILAGSRTLTDGTVLEQAIVDSGFKITTVLSGAAEGADLLGEVWAAARDIPIERYPALWKLHGKRAGRVRNQLMAERADALVAVMVRSTSPGTLDMIEKASALGLSVHIHLFDV